MTRRDIPTLEELAAEISTVPDFRSRALISTLYWSGRRIGEVLALERQDVKPYGDDTLLVDFKISKKRDSKPVIKTAFPMNDLVAGIFTRYVEEFDSRGYSGKLFKITPQRSWQIIKSVFGRDATNHWFRHVRASHLGTVMEPMELLAYFGWSDINMAIKYTHSNPLSVLEKMRKVK